MSSTPPQNKVAIVTGGARGIPRAVALDLARSGWSVAICYRRSEVEAQTALEELQEVGLPALSLKADVSDPAAVQEFVQAVRENLGPPTLLVNGAGPYHRVNILEETPEGWQAMIDQNLNGAFYMSRLVAADMIEAGWGRMVNFAMANADRIMAQPFVTAHFIAKTGILILTRTLAKQLAPHGITVNAISPGYIDSGSPDSDPLDQVLPRIPAGRLGTVEDTVHTVRYLLSPEADYVSGSNIHLSGGWGI